MGKMTPGRELFYGRATVVRTAFLLFFQWAADDNRLMNADYMITNFATRLRRSEFDC